MQLTRVRADSSSLRDTSSLWSQNYDTERHCIAPGNAVRSVDNAVPCHRTGYDKHNVRTPTAQMVWKRGNERQREKQDEAKNTEKRRKEEKTKRYMKKRQRNKCSENQCEHSKQIEADISRRAEEKYPRAWGKVDTQRGEGGTPRKQTSGKYKLRQSQTNRKNKQTESKADHNRTRCGSRHGHGSERNYKHCHAMYSPSYSIGLYLCDSGVHTAIIATLPPWTKPYIIPGTRYIIQKRKLSY